MTNRLPDAVRAQLAGCSEWVSFPSQQDLAKAVGHLLGCHRHNFVVLPDGGWALVVSETALECLRTYFSELELHQLCE